MKKTKEHVIPRWLIQLTGDPKRRARFGPDFETASGSREFAFDNFHFPACQACNNHGSALEGRAQKVVRALLDDRPVSGAELSTLLDWLDKVRIGLWLAHYYLDRNMAAIRPHFHIADRIGRQDRAVAVLRTSRDIPGMNYAGTVGLCFQYSPTAFVLRIKHVVMMNASAPGLCSRALGFPFLDAPAFTSADGPVEGTLAPGLQAASAPFAPEFRRPAIAALFMQPIASFAAVGSRHHDLLSTEYVRGHSLDVARGLGRVFKISGDSAANALLDDDEVVAVPILCATDETVFLSAVDMTMDTQLALLRGSGSRDRLSPDDQAKHADLLQRLTDFNEQMKAHNRRDVESRGSR